MSGQPPRRQPWAGHDTGSGGSDDRSIGYLLTNLDPPFLPTAPESISLPPSPQSRGTVTVQSLLSHLEGTRP